MSVLTPYYHPYARLWLPLLALGWMVMGGSLVRIFVEDPSESPASLGRAGRAWVTTFLCLALGIMGTISVVSPRGATGGHLFGPFLAPSASLRLACRELLRSLPENIRGLRLLGRPPITFYLAGRSAVQPQADLESLLRPGDPSAWAVVDFALL